MHALPFPIAGAPGHRKPPEGAMTLRAWSPGVENVNSCREIARTFRNIQVRKFVYAALSKFGAEKSLRVFCRPFIERRT
jgi:hypothetical protein